jgi:hypothetical protein
LIIGLALVVSRHDDLARDIVAIHDLDNRTPVEGCAEVAVCVDHGARVVFSRNNHAGYPKRE